MKQQKFNLPSHASSSSSSETPLVCQAQRAAFRDPALTPIDSSDDEDRPCQYAVLQPSTGTAVNPSYASSPLVCSVTTNVNAQRLPSNVQQPPLAGNTPWGGGLNHQYHVTPPVPNAFAQPPKPTPSWVVTAPYHCSVPSLQSSMRGLECKDKDNHLNVGLPSPVSEDGEAMKNQHEGDVDMTEDTHEPQEIPTSSHPPPQAYTKLASSQQKQKKPKIFMGYRADCEKCLMGVPGHYNHIIKG